MLPQSQIETHLQIYAVHFVGNFPCHFFIEFKSTVLVLLNYLAHSGVNFRTTMITNNDIDTYAASMQNMWKTDFALFNIVCYWI